MKKTIEEVKEWLLENRVDSEGDLALRGLDFSDFDGNVWIGDMKVKKNLWQHEQEVGGDLFQYRQTVGGGLYQYEQTAGGDLYQHDQKVKGDTIQVLQGRTVEDNIRQINTNPEWLVRVINEENELDAKIAKLVDYLDRQDEKDTNLVDQLIAMLRYDKVLKLRIYMAGKKGNK